MTLSGGTIEEYLNGQQVEFAGFCLPSAVYFAPIRLGPNSDLGYSSGGVSHPFSASLQLLPRIRRFRTPTQKVPAIMKVAIFSPYATVVPHFETELDIAQQHLDNGDLVEFVNCTGGLANCDFNTERDPQRCQQCIGRRQMGLELLEPQVRSEDFSDDLATPASNPDPICFRRRIDQLSN